MDGPVLDALEMRRGAVRRHVTDPHLQDLRPGAADELAGSLVDGDVVSVLIPDEDSDVLEAVGRLAEERDRCELLCVAEAHRGGIGRITLNLAPCGSASS